jgi:hypothetical protein
VVAPVQPRRPDALAPTPPAISTLIEVVFGEGVEVVHTQVLAAYSVQRIATAAEDLLVGGAEQGLALFDRPRDPPQARRLPVLWG